MKRYLTIFAVLLAVAFFSTCKKDPEVNVQDFTITKENITIGTTTVSIMGAHDWPGKIDCIKALVSENEYHFNMEEYVAELSANNFSIVMEGLKPGTTYYYFYSVDYGAKSDFETEMKSFTTNDYSLPNVITATVSYVGPDYAVCGGEVADDGGSEVTQRGVCWAQQPNPTIQDNHTVDSCGTGVFTSELKNLALNTKYYVRAYATNEKGTAYGNDMEFTTSAQAPAVVTKEVTDIGETSARVKCEVSHDGGSAVTERGVCWSKDHEPTLDDEHLANGSGLGMFICALNGLEPDVTYQVRAYAKNASGLGFGEVLTFTTNAQVQKPTVSTVEVTDVTATSATCTGNVSSDGGAEVTERGACWSTTENPTTNDTHLANGSGTGSFTVNMTGLTANKTYYVRTYATNSQGTAYGEQKTFTTTEGLAVVTTGSVTEVTATSAKCGGNVTDQGASAVTERGICWSTNHSPTINDSHIAGGSGTGSFTCQMTGLTPNATYYVRAYAKNSQGVSYGSEVNFTALEGLPVVTTNDVTDITANTAKCGGNVTDQGGSNVTERGVCWSTSHNPTTTDAHANSGTGGGSYTCTMTGLAQGITYYVRAYAKNTQGISYGEEKQFTTPANKPTVTTNSITDITQTTATGGGNVTNDGGATVTERGICWSTSQNPTINGSHVANGTGTGSFTCQMTGLTAGTKYYVRAYATNSAGISYGNQVDFTTPATLPTVTTAQVSNITQTTALGGGNVTNDGGANVIERGICWSTSHNPTIDGSHANSGTGTGSFTANMTGLTANTTYYVRAYAKNSQGIAYGNEVNFTTSQNISAPTVTTSQVTNITQTTATGGGNVTSDGGANVTERGICWSTSHSPTTSGNHANSGTGTGSFSVQMSGLTANTTYYVRAYAVNSQGTSYGSEVSFTTTANLPTVTTSNVSNITQTTATGGGNVTNDGGASVTERGICWSTSHNPTTSGSHANSGTGTGSFTANMTGLTANTTYYVRAYAKNSQGTAYGSEVNFTTSQNISAPTVTTSQVTNITQTTATGGGNVTNDGGANVTERGICWSTNHNPTTSGNHANSGTGTGSYTVQMSGLTANTTYYVRAYAVNSQGTSYGSEVSFTTTANLPTVTTSNVSNITQTTATGGGNITSDGGASITARGICWSTSQNPTTSNSHTTDGTGTGSFTSSMTGLTANTTYYVRAYATNSAGTSYGSQVTFTTLQNVSLPTVTTSNVSNITQTTATGGGNVTNDGGANVTERGICWSTSHSPTTSGNHANSGTGTGSYTVQMSGLTANTTYYVRAYAKNSAGTAYGSEMSFTTQSGGGSGTLTFTANGVTFEMIEVEGGTFWMGAQSTNPSGQNYDSEAYDSEHPVHQVTLSSYHIGKFEVTQQLWQAVMGSNPSYITGDSQRPVEQVSWNDCQAFITALNELCAGQLNGKQFYLPTEAQWEYAARGGKHSQGYKYSGSNTIGDVAWYDSNSGSTTHAVGTKTPNELGLYDMSGNVYEWCSDWYGSYGSNAQTDPTGPSTGSNRVVRGGGWCYYARRCRVSYRDYFAPDYRGSNLGLRLSFR